MGRSCLDGDLGAVITVLIIVCHMKSILSILSALLALLGFDYLHDLGTSFLALDTN